MAVYVLWQHGHLYVVGACPDICKSNCGSMAVYMLWQHGLLYLSLSLYVYININMYIYVAAALRDLLLCREGSINANILDLGMAWF